MLRRQPRWIKRVLVFFFESEAYNGNWNIINMAKCKAERGKVLIASKRWNSPVCNNSPKAGVMMINKKVVINSLEEVKKSRRGSINALDPKKRVPIRMAWEKSIFLEVNNNTVRAAVRAKNIAEVNKATSFEISSRGFFIGSPKGSRLSRPSSAGVSRYSPR